MALAVLLAAPTHAATPAFEQIAARGGTTADTQPTPSPGELGSSPALTLEAALRYALDHYPTVRAALEEVTASSAGVDVARSLFLPRLDAVWQTNRATVNNVTGLLLPQSAVSSISGPPLASVSGQSVWGTAAGALFSWEPMDFGLRRATVASAEAAVSRARADETLTRLDVQGAVGGAFLAVAVTQRAVVAAQADVARRGVLARVARTLADNQLRPGAEASRADAERAAASTRLAQARHGLAVAQATLQRVLGAGAGVALVNADALLSAAPSAQRVAATVPHPLTQARQAALDEARAREDALAKTFVPRLFVQSSVFARGSGADPNGQLHGGADGLGLERPNWAAGIQVVFPNLFELSSVRARRTAAAAATRAQTARLDEAALLVTNQREASAALVEAARAVARETPTQVAAAQQAEAQARARYEAGLASIVEVAEAQSLLAQADVQDQVARVDVWRALLAEAVAHGSLEPFLALIAAVGPR
jgi:outer membrane protein TolC